MYAEYKTRRNGDRLLGVHVIYRHGARTPVYKIPTTTSAIPPANWPAEMTADVEKTMVPFSLVDLEGKPKSHSDELVGKYITIKELPGGARSGWLTQRGQEELFALGQRLRRQYVKEESFIGSKFDPLQVYSRSTGYPRNIASTRSLLAGLFDRSEDSENELKIHISGFEEEILSPNRHSCALVMDSNNNFEEHDFPPGILAAREKAREIFGQDALVYTKYAEDGSVVSTRQSRLHPVRDELTCRIYHGFPVSDEIKEFAESLHQICPLEMVENVCGPHDIWESRGFKAAAGQFCHLLLKNLDEQAASRSHRMRLFATHDDMLLTLLIILDMFDGNWPKFGADLILELYEKKDGSLSVQVIFCEKVLAEKPLSEFKKLLEKYALTPEEYEQIRDVGLS